MIRNVEFRSKLEPAPEVPKEAALPELRPSSSSPGRNPFDDAPIMLLKVVDGPLTDELSEILAEIKKLPPAMLPKLERYVELAIIQDYLPELCTGMQKLRSRQLPDINELHMIGCSWTMLIRLAEGFEGAAECECEFEAEGIAETLVRLGKSLRIASPQLDWSRRNPGVREWAQDLIYGPDDDSDTIPPEPHFG